MNRQPPPIPNRSVPASANGADAVEVLAPGRLHLGFIDLGAALGRRFGSIGLAVEDLGTRVRAEFAPEWQSHGHDAGRALRYARQLAAAWSLDRPMSVVVDQAPPAHAGLGSGTQLAMAVGVAMARLTGRIDGAPEIAALLGRGARSGIGIGAFDSGGFLVDGGRADGTVAPPVVSRLSVPENWRVVLLFDDSHRGLHGEAERRAFSALPPFPESAAAHLSHRVLMQILPALAEADLGVFGEGIATVQRIVGDHFAPAQGGRYTSARVAMALAWLESEGISGVGQSSWGPTGFALTANQAEAERLVAALTRRFGGSQGLRFSVHAPRNRGACIRMAGQGFHARASASEPAPALRLAASR